MKSLYLCFPPAGVDSIVIWSQIKWLFGLSGHDPGLTIKLKISQRFSCQIEMKAKGSESLWALEWFCFLLQCYSLHLNSPSLVAHEGKAPSQLEKSVTSVNKDPNLQEKIKICMLVLETSEFISFQNKNSYKKTDYLVKLLLRARVDWWFLKCICKYYTEEIRQNCDEQLFC